MLKKDTLSKKINLTDNAKKVLALRYLKKNDDGEPIEEPEDLFLRVAENIASIEKDPEKWTKIFYDVMANLEFLPNSPTLMNAGRELQQLAACFVLPVGDSMEEIFEAVKNTALIHKTGGGTGFSFSRLRPANDRVKSTKGVSSGPLSFMRVFDIATETVKQGGCFVGDTLVATVKGPRKIKELKKGELLYSMSEKGYVLRPCSDSWLTIKNAEVWKITTDKGLIIYATKNHPIMPKVGFDFEKKNYIKIEDLKPGFSLMSMSRYIHKIASVEVSHIEDVHNVEVEDTHNFVVCNDTMSTGVVVSNTRRGANMGILDVSHPDILDFISIKEKDGVLSNFNISVAITDEFMKALKNDKEYPLRNPRSGQVVSHLKASDVFKKIVNCAWKNGEPGIIFIDKINDKNPTPHVGKVESTNPCGEQPLLPYESCNLGSINLTKIIDENNDINFDKLENIVKTATRFLDNVIDLNMYPLPSIDKMTKGNRKIGLGVMGFADMLIKLGIPYNSSEALNLAEKIMKLIQEKGREESRALAKERGAFPNFKGSVYDDGPELRNATITTIAPTGTLSMITSCSSGIEPLFSLVYEKNVLDGRKFLEVHPDFLRVAKQEGFYSESLMKQVMKSGSISEIQEIPQKIRDTFVTAHDIDPKTHIDIQAAFQKYTDNAVSKTINFRHDATIEDVETAYKMAYESGCKGVTVYRDGSRGNQVMTVGSSEKLHKIIARDIKLPTIFNNGPTRIIKKEGKKFYLHFSYLPEDTKNEFPIVFWIHTNAKYKADELKVCNKAARNLATLALTSGVDSKFVNETLDKANADYPHNRLGRMVSLCLRHNVPREDILVSLMNIDGDNISTLLTAVRKFLSETLSNGTILKGLKCPKCDAALIMQEGCKRCSSCTWTACG